MYSTEYNIIFDRSVHERILHWCDVMPPYCVLCVWPPAMPSCWRSRLVMAFYEGFEWFYQTKGTANLHARSLSRHSNRRRRRESHRKGPLWSCRPAEWQLLSPLCASFALPRPTPDSYIRWVPDLHSNDMVCVALRTRSFGRWGAEDKWVAVLESSPEVPVSEHLLRPHDSWLVKVWPLSGASRSDWSNESCVLDSLWCYWRVTGLHCNRENTAQWWSSVDYYGIPSFDWISASCNTLGCILIENKCKVICNQSVM